MSVYAGLGGDAGVRALVDRFYDLMDDLPEASVIRAMHPADLTGSREKLYMFLSGWSGGPQLYWKRYGHPRLRMRHLPFAIDAAARDAWILCMTQALDERVQDPMLRGQLASSLGRVADHMLNRR